jgi:hypothetical protein
VRNLALHCNEPGAEPASSWLPEVPYYRMPAGAPAWSAAASLSRASRNCCGGR